MSHTSTVKSTHYSQVLSYFILLIAGFGGLLYGIDIGVIDPALTYLNQSVQLSEQELSAVVAAVLAGSILGSVVAGMLADWLGRRKMLIVSGLMFVSSVAIIYLSQSFIPLLIGRLLQGTSGGVIAVIIPLFLAETLPSNLRGRGMATFQFMLTLGIVFAAFIGGHFISEAEHSIKAAGDNQALALEAADAAWRGMFLSVVYPGVLFLLGSFFVPESPRWLIRQGREVDARRVLARMRTIEECDRELEGISKILQAERARPKANFIESLKEILTERRYVLPFVLACIVLGCSQATGINSILQFMSTILQKAGLDPVSASSYGTTIKIVNSVMTIVGLLLVERKGRVFLLKIGTGGIVLALCTLAITFYSFESQRRDVREAVSAMVQSNQLVFNVNELAFIKKEQKEQLSILYRYGDKQSNVDAFTSVASETSIATNQSVRITPDPTHIDEPLVIVRATIGPIPSRATGLLTALCIAVFIAFFSIGPGVCVWLALSELMPTRIRSVGMGIALLINQGVATLIAASFLPIVGNFGFYAMFTVWALCTVIYFITATWFLPETRGKSLEEIEQHFAQK